MILLRPWIYLDGPRTLTNPGPHSLSTMLTISKDKYETRGPVHITHCGEDGYSTTTVTVTVAAPSTQTLVQSATHINTR